MSKNIKINVPIFSNLEEVELERTLTFHLDEFTNEIMKTISHDREIIILKKVIEKQEKEIERLSNIKLYACDVNKNKECNKKHCYINGGECYATTDTTKVKYINLDDYIHKDKIREKLKEIEGYVDTYEAVKELEELLEE